MMKRFILSLVLAFVLAAPHASAQEVVDQSKAALAWINSFRAQQGRGPIVVSEQLGKTAAVHARDMERARFFSHTGSDRSSVGDRAKRQGYHFCFIAENLAKGPRSIDQALQGWAGSPGHRKNMLAAQAREFAVMKTAGGLWVMVLGRDGC